MAGTAAIDWTRPWLAPYRAQGEAAASAIAQGLPVARALQGAGPPGKEIRKIKDKNQKDK